MAAGEARQNVYITVPLKYLSNIWRTLELPLISFENKLKQICQKILSFQVMLQDHFKLLKKGITLLLLQLKRMQSSYSN